MSKVSTTFRSVSYGPCPRTGVTCVASDFGGIISFFDNILKLLRSAEKTVRKIARLENHKRFDVRCSRFKMTPTSISVTTNVTGARAQHIVKKAELQLLGVRIRQCTYTIKKLNESLTTDKQQLEAILNSDEMAETERPLTAAQRHTFGETRSRQQSKFERLYNKSVAKKEVTDTDIVTNRWVMNLSDRQISDDERSMLSKGLNFAITPTTLPVVEIIAGTEVGSREIHNRDRRRRTQRGGCTYNQTS